MVISSYTYCPDRGKRGVRMVVRSASNCYNECRYCGFNFDDDDDSGYHQSNYRRWSEAQLIATAEEVFGALESLHTKNWRTRASRGRAEQRLDSALVAWRSLVKELQPEKVAPNEAH